MYRTAKKCWGRAGGGGCGVNLWKIIISSLQFSSSGTRDKEKEQKITVCTSELKDIKDMTSDVINAVKAGKKNNTEDPVSMKLVLKELQLALGTFLSSASASWAFVDTRYQHKNIADGLDNLWKQH